jgi:hypothetical protein
MGPNTCVVCNDAMLIYGHIEINPDKNPLSLDVNLVYVFHIYLA